MVARLRDAIRRGTTAAKPAATAVDVGTLYFDTDLDKLQRSDGTAWQDVERADVSGGPAAFVGAKAYHSTTQSYPVANADVAMQFDSEEFDTDGFHDPATNNTRMTVPSGKGGKYRLHAFTYTGIQSIKQIRFRKNGTTLLRGAMPLLDSAAIQATLTTSLAVGDYVEALYLSQTGTQAFGHGSAPEAQSVFEFQFLGA